MLSRGLTLLLAVTAGVMVANIYYAQPLLELISAAFHVSHSAVSWVAVATQLGYAAGLLLLVPLGDLLNKKRLIAGSAFAAAAVGVAVAVSPNLPWMVAASFAFGLISITPQLAVPYAAGLAEPARRGRAVGTIMSGLLIGILVSRSASGFLGAALGWRPVFWVGAALSAVMGLALCRLPASPEPENNFSYPGLLKSLFPLLAQEPVLRRHAAIGALGFATFSAFWTTLPFYFAARPEHYGSQMVGLFALLAVTGAGAALVTGRLADKYPIRRIIAATLALAIAGFVCIGQADRSLAWLVAGVLLMDAGIQGNQISNQTRIYSLAPQLRNRLTSVYMIIYFLGGAAGSAVGSYAWSIWHWNGVWGVSVVCLALALARLFWPGKDA